MRQMKDSGLEWIGEIPNSWLVEKYKYHFFRHEPKNPGDKIVLSLYRDLGVIPKDSRDDNHNQTSEDTSKYKYVVPGDFVVNKMKAWQGSVAVSKYEGIVSPAYYVYKFNGQSFNKQYFHYLIRGCYKDEFMRLSGGMRVGQWDLSADDLENISILIPPIEEQQKIADFLDKKCAEIDNLIVDIQTQIETLEQYKKSVITQAVTKGLNPDVELKDSGLEWIGKVPVSWNLSKIGNLYKVRNQKVSDKDFPPLSVTMKGVVPQLETAAKSNDGDNRKLVRIGDFAINSRSDRRGSCGISSYDGSVSTINIVLMPLKIMNPKYYNWLFHTVQFADEYYKNGHGIVDDLWTTTWQEMKKIVIPVPSVGEQKEIADFLDKKCKEIDDCIDSKKEQIETLENYKKSVIYEYVTGKKEVF